VFSNDSAVFQAEFISTVNIWIGTMLQLGNVSSRTGNASARFAIASGGKTVSQFANARALVGHAFVTRVRLTRASLRERTRKCYIKTLLSYYERRGVKVYRSRNFHGLYKGAYYAGIW